MTLVEAIAEAVAEVATYAALDTLPDESAGGMGCYSELYEAKRQLVDLLEAVL